MRKEVFVGSALGVITAVLLLVFVIGPKYINPIIEEDRERPLSVYSIPALRKADIQSSEVVIGDDIDYGDSIITKAFTMQDTVAKKTVSGVIALPDTRGEYPVVIMFRGFVDKEIYRPGLGTQRTATKLAESGYIAIAPDFLGYGSSEIESSDSLEARFQTYTTALTVLESLDEFNAGLAKADVQISINTDDVALWGHSNGGQIAMTTLAVTGKKYPTMLWAPVSKKFPDSILAFADEMDDGGEFLRTLITVFQSDYNMSLYAFNNYLHWVKAPIQLHQGGQDDAVPVEWSRDFEKELQNAGIDISYYEYPNENHNFTDGDWDTVIRRDLDFLQESF